MYCQNGHKLQESQRFCAICGSLAQTYAEENNARQIITGYAATSPQTCPHGVIVAGEINPCIYCSNTASEPHSANITEVPIAFHKHDGIGSNGNSKKRGMAIVGSIALLAVLIFGINTAKTRAEPNYDSWTMSGLLKGDESRMNNLLNEACTRSEINLPDLVVSMDDVQSEIDSNYTAAFSYSPAYVTEVDTYLQSAADQALKATLSQDYSKLSSPVALASDIATQMKPYCQTEPSPKYAEALAMRLDKKINGIKKPGKSWIPAGYVQGKQDPNYAWKWSQDKGTYYVTVDVINHQTCKDWTTVNFGIALSENGQEVDSDTAYDYANIGAYPHHIQLEYVGFYSDQQNWFSIKQISCG